MADEIRDDIDEESEPKDTPQLDSADVGEGDPKNLSQNASRCAEAGGAPVDVAREEDDASGAQEAATQDAGAVTGATGAQLASRQEEEGAETEASPSSQASAIEGAATDVPSAALASKKSKTPYAVAAAVLVGALALFAVLYATKVICFHDKQWSEPEADYVQCVETSQLACTRCGKVFDASETAIDTLAENGKFACSANELATRWQAIANGESMSITDGENEVGSPRLVWINDLSAGGGEGEESAGLRGFGGFYEGSLGGDDWQDLMVENADERGRVSMVYVISVSTDEDDLVGLASMYALMRAVDPTITFDEAVEVEAEIADNKANSSSGVGVVENNDITYILTNEMGAVAFYATPQTA